MSYDLKISNGDLMIGTNGDLQKVENSEKLEQDILKILLFPIGGNRFARFYGSPISANMVGSTYDMEFLNTYGSAGVKTALETLQKLQRQQIANQKMTPAEILAAVQEVKIDRNAIDPRYISIIVRVLSNALTTISTAFRIKAGL